VRAVGREAVQVDFRWKGQRCRERLRLKPTPANLKYATRLKATIEHEIATGTFSYEKHFPDSGRANDRHERAFRRAESYFSDYVGSLGQSVQPETVREYRQAVAQVVAGVGDHALANLTRAHFRQWIAKSPLSKKRLDNLLIPIRGALAQALEDGLIQKNPLEGFKFRRVGGGKVTIDPFTPEEVERLGRTVHGDLWTFWAWTGLRSGEVIGLRWGDVDPDCTAVHVRRAVRLGREKRPKTEAGTRRLLLLPRARGALGPRRGGVEAVFRNPRTGRDWHEAKALARAFRRDCRVADVRYRYVYQLRHTFASWALSSGENPLWVARQMGHTDVSMIFRHYGKWIPEMDKEAGSRMSGKARRGQRAA